MITVYDFQTQIGHKYPISYPILSYPISLHISIYPSVLLEGGFFFFFFFFDYVILVSSSRGRLRWFW